MCTLASSEFSHETVKTHIETVINALKVSPSATFYLISTEKSALNFPLVEFELLRRVEKHIFMSVVFFFFIQTERDVSVRQRAVDLLYAMCDRSNAKQIVAEMLSYLETADYSIREEIVRLLLSPTHS